MKKIRFVLFVFIPVFWVVSIAAADVKKITILYTGETHSMLYSCDCPLGLDGGVSARSTKIKQIRKETPNVLLLDSGGVFAGGLLDEYSQNVDLDKKRTLINLEAMKIMGYDAIAIGDEEFNFGDDFLKSAAKEKTLSFISSNIEDDYLQPALLKQVGGIKIGILALSTPDVKNKLENIKYIGPEEALEKGIKNLRAEGAAIIVVLSHLGEEQDLSLINRVPGIDILVCGHRLANNPNPEIKVKDTIILRPAWQGRKLGRVDLEIENGKVIKHTIKDINIDKEIKDDPQISAILPKCFSDKNCRQKSLIGTCEKPATLFAKCVFKKPEPVSLLVIKPKICASCDVAKGIEDLGQTFANLKISYLDYETKEGADLVKKFGIDMLPAYIFSRDVEKSPAFTNFSKVLMVKGDKYLLDPSVLGVSFFVGRQRTKGSLDLFISLYDANAQPLLEMMKDFLKDKEKLKFKIHFLGLIDGDRIITPNGLPELEEDSRSACVLNNYPDKWWDYFSCRSKNIQSTWWDYCMDSCGINVNSVKQCIFSPAGKKMLLENISLSSELKIRSSGTFLIENQEVFSVVKTPKKEELERLIK